MYPQNPDVVVGVIGGAVVHFKAMVKIPSNKPETRKAGRQTSALQKRGANAKLFKDVSENGEVPNMPPNV